MILLRPEDDVQRRQPPRPEKAVHEEEFLLGLLVVVGLLDVLGLGGASGIFAVLVL